MSTPTARARELRGTGGRDRGRGSNTTTRRPQMIHDATETTESDETTRARAHHRVQTHHSQGGSENRKREGKDRSSEGARKEGRVGRPDVRREEEKGKESAKEPPPPKPHTARDQAIHPGTEHQRTGGPSGHAWDPGASQAEPVLGGRAEDEGKTSNL